MNPTDNVRLYLVLIFCWCPQYIVFPTDFIESRFIVTVYSGVYYNLPGCSNAWGDFQKKFKKLLTIIR